MPRYFLINVVGNSKKTIRVLVIKTDRFNVTNIQNDID